MSRKHTRLNNARFCLQTYRVLHGLSHTGRSTCVRLPPPCRPNRMVGLSPRPSTSPKAANSHRPPTSPKLDAGRARLQDPLRRFPGFASLSRGRQGLPVVSPCDHAALVQTQGSTISLQSANLVLLFTFVYTNGAPSRRLVQLSCNGHRDPSLRLVRILALWEQSSARRGSPDTADQVRIPATRRFVPPTAR